MNCHLCENEIPKRGNYHIPSQSKGMIATTRCLDAPLNPALEQWLADSGSRVRLMDAEELWQAAQAEQAAEVERLKAERDEAQRQLELSIAVRKRK